MEYLGVSYNNNKKVTAVIVLPAEQVLDENLLPNEIKAVNFIKNVLKQEGNWALSDTNGSVGYNYPGIGFDYDDVKKAFISPKPNEEIGAKDEDKYVLDETTYTWVKKKDKQ